MVKRRHRKPRETEERENGQEERINRTEYILMVNSREMTQWHLVGHCQNWENRAASILKVGMRNTRTQSYLLTFKNLLARQFNIQEFYKVNTLPVCALGGSHNKQQTFLYTLTDCLLQPICRVFTARYGLNPYLTQISFVFKGLICLLRTPTGYHCGSVVSRVTESTEDLAFQTDTASI
jgi:hypothetical protein